MLLYGFEKESVHALEHVKRRTYGFDTFLIEIAVHTTQDMKNQQQIMK